MNIYTKKITDVIQSSGRANRSMRKKFLAPHIHKAGMEFLERIHKECGIGATKEELEEEREELLKQKNSQIKTEKPELTIEYLKSLGLHDYCSW
jgi:hypothetical protein